MEQSPDDEADPPSSPQPSSPSALRSPPSHIERKPSLTYHVHVTFKERKSAPPLHDDGRAAATERRQAAEAELQPTVSPAAAPLIDSACNAVTAASKPPLAIAPKLESPQQPPPLVVDSLVSSSRSSGRQPPVHSSSLRRAPAAPTATTAATAAVAPAPHHVTIPQSKHFNLLLQVEQPRPATAAAAAASDAALDIIDLTGPEAPLVSSSAEQQSAPKHADLVPAVSIRESQPQPLLHGADQSDGECKDGKASAAVPTQTTESDSQVGLAAASAPARADSSSEQGPPQASCQVCLTTYEYVDHPNAALSLVPRMLTCGHCLCTSCIHKTIELKGKSVDHERHTCMCQRCR